MGKILGDKTERSIFQKELEKSVSRKIALLVVIGGIFFCVAILGINRLEQEYNKEKYLEALSQTFENVYNAVSGFLENEDNKKIFVECMKGETETGEVKYLLSKYNVDAPADIQLILTDAQGNIVFSSFSAENMNLHRIEFNRIVGENAHRNKNEIYNAIYYFSGDTSEYVFVLPLFEDGNFAGDAAVYLNGSEWRSLLSAYQYDAVITSKNGDIIFCSNHSFLPERSTNKYKGKISEEFIWVNESRYMADHKILQDKQIHLYSFIYSPRNYIYVLIGVGTILVLGFFWTYIFFGMSRSMAVKTAESVSSLVGEMRIIRKEDKEHVIQIHTGDEFEEIANQINKMVKSINELNDRNMDLIKINSLMEMQNLQTQINPHFLYNTLDNIKYLIAPEPLRAAALIERFTHILRYSIDNSRHRVRLEEDMHYLEDYLVIQNTRFGERFTYRIDISEACGCCLIPKLLLQPLVENSIKYGFKKKMKIRVFIKGWLEDGYLILVVADDGAGVPKSTLETLRAIISKEEMNTPHNGLQNINRRMMLEYGQKSGMELDSVDGEEFKVTLKLRMGQEDL